MYDLSESAKAKWSPLLDENKDKGFSAIKDNHRRIVTARLLENQEEWMNGEGRGVLKEISETTGLNESVTTTQGGASPLANWDPILISLVRRAMPNLMAYDTCGVQPMTGPTGLIFSMKSRYTSQNGSEALFNVANTAFSGQGSEAMTAANYYASNNAASGSGMTTNAGEGLGGTATNDGSWNDMSFSIDKATATAITRGLRAEYTTEVAQDLKAIHGLDAETELSNILATEILAEINREVIHNIRKSAKLGSQPYVYSSGAVLADSNGNKKLGTAGTFDLTTNTDGRWSSEKYKALLFKIHHESNAIAKDTRRGRGNFIICSSDVAAALDLTGKLMYAPAINDSLVYDDTGNTFVGILSGRYKVYIDPYSTYDEIIVGYKGANAWDAGIYYCPYVPLQMVKALDPLTFQPKIAFKTRYAIVANPFGSLTGNANPYFRKFMITGL